MGGISSRRMDFEQNPDIIAILQYLAQRLATYHSPRDFTIDLSPPATFAAPGARARCFPNLSLSTSVSFALCLSLPPSSALAYAKRLSPSHRRSLFFTSASSRCTEGSRSETAPRNASTASPSLSGIGDTSPRVHAVRDLSMT